MEFLALCKINDAHRGVVDWECWPHLEQLVRDFEANRMVIVLKPKQVGISFILAFYDLWKALTVPGWNSIIISSGQDEAADLLEKCKFAYLNLPKWLQSSIPFNAWSKTEISFPSMGSKIVAEASTEKAGVGKTCSLVVIDEWDFHDYPEADWATAEPTASAGGQIIGVSTIRKNFPDSIFKQKYKQAKQGLNNFHHIFLPWSIRPGRDENWYETERKNFIEDKNHHFEENYPTTEEEALSPISGRTFFDSKVLQSLLDSATEPMETRNNITHVYTKFIPQMAYACGADISQGIGQDYQSFWILGKRGMTIEDVALIHCNDITPPTFAFYCYELAKEYNFPLLVAEVNNPGFEYIRNLLDLNYPKLYEEKKGKVGWTTNENNRERALHELGGAIANGTLVIRYKPAILEMFDFQHVEGRDNKVKIRSVGRHDDLVMSLAIAYQMIKDLRPSGVSQRTPLVVERRTGGLFK